MMKGGKKQLFKYTRKAVQVLVTGESRDPERQMQQPGLSVPVGTLGLPNYLNFPLGLTPSNGRVGAGPDPVGGLHGASSPTRSLVSGRARLWAAPPPRRGGWGPAGDGAPATSGRRGAAGLCKTTPRATAAPDRPARGLRVPVPLVPGLTGAPRPSSPGCPSTRRRVSHPPGPARPDRTFWKAESERLNARDTQRDRDSIAAVAEPRAGGHRI